MAVHPGRHGLGPHRGRLILRTFRDGLAAQAGHDLTIEATRWSGWLDVDADGNPTGLGVAIDMGALVVRDGIGGLKPLTDRDRREIAVTARKVLGADRHPEAKFAAEAFVWRDRDAATVRGTLTLRGVARPVAVHVTETGAQRYHADATVVQSDYGIKPYTAFLGALRVRDAVDIAADIDLSEQESS
jgi:hypothetical protein